MSQSEIERFVSDLRSDAALLAEAEKTLADESQAMSSDALVSFAAGRGYSFSAEDVAKCIRAATAKPDGKHLGDAELEAVAGGGGFSRTMEYDGFSDFPQYPRNPILDLLGNH